MTIKDLIQQNTVQKQGDLKRPVLNSSDTLYQAFYRFVKSKAAVLPVVDNREYMGELSVFQLAEAMIEDYSQERERRYRLIVGINQSLTKIKALVEKMAKTHNLTIRNQLAEEMRIVVASAESLFKI